MQEPKPMIVGISRLIQAKMGEGLRRQTEINMTGRLKHIGLT